MGESVASVWTCRARGSHVHTRPRALILARAGWILHARCRRGVIALNGRSRGAACPIRHCREHDETERDRDREEKEHHTAVAVAFVDAIDIEMVENRIETLEF